MGEMYEPGEGRYEAISELEYHRSWDAWNVSRLKKLKKTPAHCMYSILHPDEQSSDAKRDGSAVHCAIIEPEAFEKRYAIDPEKPGVGGYPSGWRNTTAYKDAKKALISKDITPLPRDVRERCLRLREKLHSEPSHAHDIITASSGNEVSYAVTEPDTGLLCKLRVDVEVRSGGIIADLKKTRDIAAFDRQLFALDYHLSVPHYMDLLDELDPGTWSTHVFIVAELEPPYEFRTLQLRLEAVEYARRKWRDLMDLAAACVDSDQWPGYPRSVEHVDIPYWAYAQEEREL